MNQRKWSKDVIVEMIKDMKNQNVDLSAGHVSKKYVSLFAAASSTRHFKSWGDAVREAGIDYDQILAEGKSHRRSKITKWSKTKILKEIQKNQSLDLLTAYKDKSDLYSVARREFGSWKKALEKAGYQLKKGSYKHTNRIVEDEMLAEKKFKGPQILVVEDDKGDRLLIEKALKANGIKNSIRFLGDGQALIDYLLNEYLENTSAKKVSPLPCLILMDLNMPRLDGHEALKVVKSNDRLREIPLVILSNSNNPEDIADSYREGANSFFTKPMDYLDLVNLMGIFKNYWLEKS